MASAPSLSLGRPYFSRLHCRFERRGRPLRRCACTASAPDDTQPSTSGSSSSSYEFTYQGSDGRLKATFEQAFKTGPSAVSGSSGGVPAAPWGLGYQMAEKNLVWSDDLKARMLQRVAADRLGLSDEEVEARLARLLLLLPTLRPRLVSMKPQTLAALVAQVDEVAGRLVELKAVFPGADAAALAVREPGLVLGFEMRRLRDIAAALRALLPALNVDALVQENPSMLDIDGLQAAMAEAARILPDLDVQAAMASNPQLVFSFQRGAALIPYDPPDQPAHGDDDEYAAYYR
eukprot:scaffold8.g1437.t1